MKKQRGFSLLEMMVVVVVIAVLAGLAINSYANQVRKSKRAEAKQMLTDYALRMEKWRTNNASYTVDLTDINGAATSPSGNYSIQLGTPVGTCSNGVTASDTNSFGIAAIAQGEQSGDTGCGTIQLFSLCGDVVKQSSTDNDCW